MIHNRDQLLDPEKLADLTDTKKDGPAGCFIHRLVQMAGIHEEVIECLLNWFDWLHLIH